MNTFPTHTEHCCPYCSGVMGNNFVCWPIYPNDYSDLMGSAIGNIIIVLKHKCASCSKEVRLSVRVHKSMVDPNSVVDITVPK